MGKLILYGFDPSPPVRAVLLALKALALPFEFKRVNVAERSEEYLAKNPQNTVPTLEDDGNYIWESHAIMAYLVRKYGKTDTLYPKDFLKRAVVDQRLHFESGVVYQGAFRNITTFLFQHNETIIPKFKIDAISKVYELLELFLERHNYIAGDELTIADFSIIPTTITMAAFLDINAALYPKLIAWIQRIKALPYYEEATGKNDQQALELIKTKEFTIAQ